MFGLDYLSPIIGALIGWITNVIAVRMLFHPRRPICILGVSFQGVFPKRQAALAHRLGSIVSQELISGHEIRHAVQQYAVSAETLRMLKARIEALLVEKLPHAFPMAAILLPADAIRGLINRFQGDLESFLRSVVDSLGKDIESSIDVQKRVEDKVNAFPAEKLEELLLQLMAREFRLIEIIGAVLGGLIGCAQLLMLRLS